MRTTVAPVPRVVVIAVVLLVGACSPARLPATGSPSTSPAGTAPPAPASPASSTTTTISGEFVITNTTPGGDQVRIESMGVHLEASPAGETTWSRLAAGCETDPATPVAFDDRLVVRYTCAPGRAGIPADARLRAVVEATIAGSDQLFRMEAELPN